MFENKTALLLDMNSTFMFGEDRFGDEHDYSKYYQSIGGELAINLVNKLIHRVYHYLDIRYPSEEYRLCFPTLSEAIDINSEISLSDVEKARIIETFAYHEHGNITAEYAAVLERLHERFTLTLVADIWAPKEMWLQTLQRLGLLKLFSVYSFSSDHGMLKPSPKPFELVVQQLHFAKHQCLVVGDSIRRDLGGSLAAGLDCVLVGGAKSEQALACYPSLMEFQEAIPSST